MNTKYLMVLSIIIFLVIVYNWRIEKKKKLKLQKDDADIIHFFYSSLEEDSGNISVECWFDTLNSRVQDAGTGPLYKFLNQEQINTLMSYKYGYIAIGNVSRLSGEYFKYCDGRSNATDLKTYAIIMYHHLCKRGYGTLIGKLCETDRQKDLAEAESGEKAKTKTKTKEKANN